MVPVLGLVDVLCTLLAGEMVKAYASGVSLDWGVKFSGGSGAGGLDACGPSVWSSVQTKADGWVCGAHRKQNFMTLPGRCIACEEEAHLATQRQRCRSGKPAWTQSSPHFPSSVPQARWRLLLYEDNVWVSLGNAMKAKQSNFKLLRQLERWGSRDLAIEVCTSHESHHRLKRVGVVPGGKNSKVIRGESLAVCRSPDDDIFY